MGELRDTLGRPLVGFAHFRDRRMQHALPVLHATRGVW